MIQRIQTVYFFLAALFSTIGYYLPVFRTVISPTNVTEYTLMDYDVLGLPVLIAYAVAVALPIIALMLYKNRKLQIRVARIAILAATAALSLLVIKYGNMGKETGLEVVPGLGMFIPVGSILFLLLAIRGVKKDEALVRSADRIR